MKEMTLTLADHDGIVLDQWHITDEIDRMLFAEFLHSVELPQVTASRIRTRLETFEEALSR